MEEPEPALIRAAAAGDLGAFEHLVRTYQEPVWRFLRRLLGDPGEAEDVAQEITPTIDDLFTNGYLDPTNWRDGDYEEVFATFAPDAVATAEEGVETLTLGATAGDVFATVEPGKSKLSYQVLFDPDGAVETAVVTVVFRATAERKDGTYLAIVSEGEFFLRQIDGWTITAFDVKRDDHETQPPSPSASTSPSG